MSSRTTRFGLTVLNSPLDQVDADDHKMTDADRRLIDRLLTLAVEAHNHTGIAATTTTPGPPTITLSPLGGILPSNTTLYYRTSLVDARGEEQIASSIAVAHTNAQLQIPAPATLTTGTGTLMGGTYTYAVSAYTDQTNRETRVSNPTVGTLVGSGGWVVTLPPPPSGATGWNLYRQGPTDANLVFLAELPLDQGPYEDNGTVAANTLRRQPASNTTSTSSSATISPIGGVPAGYTLKAYRTTDPGRWEHSLIGWTADGSILDTGHATQTGTPPTASAGTGGAPRIDLTDLIGATGDVPPGLLTTTATASFTFTGPVETGVSSWLWVNELDQVHLLALRATLGRGSTPAVRAVRVGLDLLSAGSLTWVVVDNRVTSARIVADIPPGESSSPSVPFTNTAALDVDLTLHPGDALRARILQSGGGATPTDTDLTITVTMAARHGSTEQSYQWEPT